MTDVTQQERDALYVQLAIASRSWTEIHYCVSDFCDLLGIPFGVGKGWEEHQAIADAVLDVFVVEAKKRGWQAPDR